MPDLPNIPERTIRELQAGIGVERNFETVFRAYHGTIRAYFERHGIDGDGARDLTQDVFLSVHAKITTLRDPCNFKGWMFGIARNKLLQLIEERGRIRLVREPQSGEGEIVAAVPDPRPTGLDQALEKERRMKLREALEELPQQMRACVKLNVLEGLEYTEIAARLGVSVNSVKVHLHRARHILTDRLGPQFGIDSGL